MKDGFIAIFVMAVIAAGVFIYIRKNRKDSPAPVLGDTEQLMQSANLIVSGAKRRAYYSLKRSLQRYSRMKAMKNALEMSDF